MKNYTQNETIESAVEFLTAGGMNDFFEAVQYWREGAEENQLEAQKNDWDPKGDWSEVWFIVITEIALLLMKQGGDITLRDGEIIAEATQEQALAYLLALENREGFVSGAVVGLPEHRAIYIA